MHARALLILVTVARGSLTSVCVPAPGLPRGKEARLDSAWLLLSLITLDQAGRLFLLPK